MRRSPGAHTTNNRWRVRQCKAGCRCTARGAWTATTSRPAGDARRKVTTVRDNPVKNAHRVSWLTMGFPRYQVSTRASSWHRSKQQARGRGDTWRGFSRNVWEAAARATQGEQKPGREEWPWARTCSGGGDMSKAHVVMIWVRVR